MCLIISSALSLEPGHSLSDLVKPTPLLQPLHGACSYLHLPLCSLESYAMIAPMHGREQSVLAFSPTMMSRPGKTRKHKN